MAKRERKGLPFPSQAACALAAALAISACESTQTPDLAASTVTDAESLDDCYDETVSARIIKQTPSVMPECDCIIMRWPWFVELDIAKVANGRARTGKQTVLSVQHTDFVSKPRPEKWRLRRNTSGGFNLIGFASGDHASCPAGTPPAEPFISSGPGQTLKDLEREGAKYYGRDR